MRSITGQEHTPNLIAIHHADVHPIERQPDGVTQSDIGSFSSGSNQCLKVFQ